MGMSQDSRYKLFQDSLDSQMKCLTRAGNSKQRKHAKPITEEEYKILWSKGPLGDNEPKTLVNTLVYLFGTFLFALRSGEEHRSLTLAQLK